MNLGLYLNSIAKKELEAVGPNFSTVDTMAFQLSFTIVLE